MLHPSAADTGTGRRLARCWHGLEQGTSSSSALKISHSHSAIKAKCLINTIGAYRIGHTSVRPQPHTRTWEGPMQLCYDFKSHQF
eukprot:1161561-Pelagomonas_calceolata.AAC.5